MGKECISGSAHVDHRSETVEKKRIIHMIPSLWGSGRAGTGCSRKTVTSNISLTDLKITKNGVTQSFLES